MCGCILWRFRYSCLSCGISPYGVCVWSRLDGICVVTKIIRCSLINCAEEIAPVLKIILSHSLSSCLIPTSFKEAAIIPVFKSGDKSLPSNYRPISLTSVLSKVIEKNIRKQDLTFVYHRGYLNNAQHGFRSGRSCLSALLDVYD